jgi:hypothetical protein
MFWTHTLIRNNKIGSGWFIVDSFRKLTASPHRQSIKTITRRDNQEKIDGGRSVSTNIQKFINDLEFKFGILISNNCSNRFDLTELEKNKRA